MRSRRKLAVLLVLTMLVAVADWHREPIVAEATATSTKEEIDRTTQERDDLANMLDITQDNLDALKDSQGSLEEELEELNQRLQEVSETLTDLEEQISEKEQTIADAQLALEEAKAAEAEQYACMVIRVRDMYERNDTSYLNAIISAGSLAEMLNVADYFEKIAAYDRSMLDEYKANRVLIEEQEKQLKADRAVLENLKIMAEAEKNKVAGLISQTANSIANFSDQISAEEEKARNYEAELKRKEEDLTYLKKKLAEEMKISQSAANSTWRNISDVKFAEGDRYLLANLIYCEAGGEPYEGQVAVGSVVINRVLSSVFPDSVVGVIYQKKQFSPVASGRLQLALASNKATADCYRAADEAMSGVTNVGNCLFFRTPIEGLSGINIGGHVFY